MDLQWSLFRRLPNSAKRDLNSGDGSQLKTQYRTKIPASSIAFLSFHAVFSDPLLERREDAHTPDEAKKPGQVMQIRIQCLSIPCKMVSVSNCKGLRRPDRSPFQFEHSGTCRKHFWAFDKYCADLKNNSIRLPRTLKRRGHQSARAAPQQKAERTKLANCIHIEQHHCKNVSNL